MLFEVAFMERKIKQSLKAGVMSGIVFGALYSFIYLILNISDILRKLSPGSLVLGYPEGGILSGSTILIYSLSDIPLYFLGSLLMGIIFGPIFGFVSNKIPAKNIYKKSVILFALIAILISLFRLPYLTWNFIYSITYIIGTFILYIAFGLVLAYFYLRFEKTNKRKKSSE